MPKVIANNLEKRLLSSAMDVSIPTELQGLLKEAANTLSRQSADMVNAEQNWLQGLNEGDNVEVIYHARVTENGHFAGPKPIQWRSLGTNFFAK